MPDPNLRRWRYLLPFIVSLPCLAIPVPGSCSEVDMADQFPDTFFALARSLANGDEMERRDFAWISVSEITRAYKQAADDSHAELPGNSRSRAKLTRWRRATREFADELAVLLGQVDTADDIRVITELSGTVTVLVDNRPVSISGPQLAASRFLQQRIVDTYCKIHDCSKLMVDTRTEPAPIPKVEPGSWTLNINRGSRYQTPDNLVFLFRDLKSRTEKQEFCQRVAHELRVLATELDAARQAGYPLDWNLLKIHAQTGQEYALVMLNENEDYLRLALPLLGNSGMLTHEVLDWVRVRSTVQTPESVVIEADLPFAALWPGTGLNRSHN